MELRFDGKVKTKAAKVKVDGFDAVVELYENGQLVETKAFTNWTDDTSASRPSINAAIAWLDTGYND
jgi:hypothetical protein